MFMFWLMKVNQQQSDLLSENSSLPCEDDNNSPKGCMINDDVIMMALAFTIFLCCIINLTYRQAIFGEDTIPSQSFQFLQIDTQRNKEKINSGAPQEKPLWYAFPDLNGDDISNAIFKKEQEERGQDGNGQEQQERKEQRQKLKKAQLAFFREKSQIAELQSIKHILYNYGDNSIKGEIEQLNKREEFIYKLRYQIDQYTNQLPFCLVVYSRDYKNIQNEYEPLLRSIFHQKYSNFRVIFIADAMDPQKLLSLYKFIQSQGYEKKVQVIQLSNRQGYARSVLKALKYSCKFAQISAIINGNDQLITQNVFSIYNAVYQKKKSKVAYGNYYQYLPTQQRIFLGHSTAYSPQQIENAAYRQGMPKVGPILTFNISLIRYIDESYLKYDQNIFYWWQDLSFKALSLQLLELSCGKIEYVFECQYLMNQNKAGLQRREFIRQIHMPPRRCYQYQSAK